MCYWLCETKVVVSSFSNTEKKRKEKKNMFLAMINYTALPKFRDCNNIHFKNCEAEVLHPILEISSS